MQTMTPLQQAQFNTFYNEVDRARTILENIMAGAPESDEDLRVSCARLDNWLTENYGRWVWVA